MAEYERLSTQGVRFVEEPADMGPVVWRCWTTPAAT